MKNECKKCGYHVFSTIEEHDFVKWPLFIGGQCGGGSVDRIKKYIQQCDKCGFLSQVEFNMGPACLEAPEVGSEK